MHALNLLRLAIDERGALPHHSAQRTYLTVWAKCPREQTKAHQLLQPLAIQHVRFLPRDVLYMPRIDQIHREAARFQQLIHRNPIDPGRFHNHRIDPTARQPITKLHQILSEALELAHRVLASIRRHRNVMALRAHIDSCRIRIHHSQFTLANRHALLHYQKWDAASARVCRCSQSLKRDAVATAHQCRRRNPRPGSVSGPKHQCVVGLRQRGIPPYNRTAPRFFSSSCHARGGA